MKEAISGRRGEYDPQALELIVKELSKRQTTAQVFDSTSGNGATGFPSTIDIVKQPATVERPYIQYVGAWGLNILLSSAVCIPLGIVLAGTRPRSLGDAIVCFVVLTVIGGCLSFMVFWLSVKWMIVDRLSEYHKAETKKKDVQPPTGDD